MAATGTAMAIDRPVRAMSARSAVDLPVSTAPGIVAGVIDRLRRAPLMVKVGGASLPLLATVLMVSWLNARRADLPPYAFTLVLVVAVATVVAHLALVAFALQPIERVGHALEGFARGDERAQVSRSPWADTETRRLENNVLALFEAVRRERARYRHLAHRVLSHADDEQGHVARELFDSTAQSMAALLFELRALSSGVTESLVIERLEGVRRIASGVLEDVKALSVEANPRWQANAGLEGALQWLIREHREITEARLTWESGEGKAPVDPAASALVYRTTRAALRYASQERCPGLDVSVRRPGDRIILEVVDARERTALQVGADPPESIEMLRARAELLGGSLELQREGDRRRLRLVIPVSPVGSGESSPTESR